MSKFLCDIRRGRHILKTHPPPFHGYPPPRRFRVGWGGFSSPSRWGGRPPSMKGDVLSLRSEHSKVIKPVVGIITINVMHNVPIQQVKYLRNNTPGYRLAVPVGIIALGSALAGYNTHVNSNS